MEHWNRFNDILEAVAKGSLPTQEDVHRRNDVVRKVARALVECKWLHEGNVQPYGSFVSGIYNSSSDLDLAIEGCVAWSFLDRTSQRKWIDHHGSQADYVPLHLLDKVAKGQVLRKVVNKLMDFRVTHRESLVYILHARVPIIKFTDTQTGIECDLAIGGEGQHLKAATFSVLKEVNYQYAFLYTVVKQWAKAHGINDGTIGMFNSHCLALLVIFYLQQQPHEALPAIYRLFYNDRPGEDAERLLQSHISQEELKSALQIMQDRGARAKQAYWGKASVSLADLFAGFIDFYVNLFHSVLVNPEQGLRLSTWYGELQQGSPIGDYVLCVEEPMNNGDNPARTFGKKGEFPWTLHCAVDVFQRTQLVMRSIRDSKTCTLEMGMAFLYGPVSFLKPPVSTVLKQLANLAGWDEWVGNALHPDGRNSGEVLGQMLSHCKMPVDEWLPRHCLDGARGWKDKLIDSAMEELRRKKRQQQQGDKVNRGQRFRQDMEQLTDAYDDEALVDAAALEEAEAAEAAALAAMSGAAGGGGDFLSDEHHDLLDNERALQAATGLTGHAAALQAAMAVAQAKAARNAIKKAKKEARDREKRERREAQRKQEQAQRAQQQQQQQNQEGVVLSGGENSGGGRSSNYHPERGTRTTSREGAHLVVSQSSGDAHHDAGHAATQRTGSEAAGGTDRNGDESYRAGGRGGRRDDSRNRGGGAGGRRAEGAQRSISTPQHSVGSNAGSNHAQHGEPEAHQERRQQAPRSAAEFKVRGAANRSTSQTRPDDYHSTAESDHQTGTTSTGMASDQHHGDRHDQESSRDFPDAHHSHHDGGEASNGDEAADKPSSKGAGKNKDRGIRVSGGPGRSGAGRRGGGRSGGPSRSRSEGHKGSNGIAAVDNAMKGLSVSQPSD